MREIKFRAKRIDTNRWVYGDYFETPLSDENSGTTPDKGWFFLVGEQRHCIGRDSVAFVVDLKTLGQFTGLLDKNRKEIYEGDVIKNDWNNQQEVIDDITEMAWLVRDGWLTGQESEGKLIAAEVIGNIYENPELLPN